jgi:Na+-driven multidrug efflux pump
VVLPATYASILATLLAPPLNWALALRAGLGLDGIALANCCSQAAALAALCFLAARREAALRSTPQQSWFGW